MSTLLSTGEIIDVNNPPKLFKVRLIRSTTKVVNYFLSLPHSILPTRSSEMVRKLMQRAKSVNTVKNLDYDKMKIEISKPRYDIDFILKDVVSKKHHIFALLRTRVRRRVQNRCLLVFSSKGVLVSKMSFLGQLLSWSLLWRILYRHNGAAPQKCRQFSSTPMTLSTQGLH